MALVRFKSAVDYLAGYIKAFGDNSGYIQAVTLVDSAGADASAASPVGVAYTDRSIANLSGSSETLMAANTSRRVLIVYNIGATSVAVNLTGGAASLTAGGSVVLPAGASMVLDQAVPTSLIKIIGTLNADVTAYEG